jgi:transketolase
VGVLDLYRIKPLNKELLSSYIEQVDGVVTLEEHVISGGIGSAISEFITDGGLKTPLERIAVASQKFPKYGNREWMLSACNIDVESTVKRIERRAKCLGLTK